MKFSTWLKRQRGRNDPIGDFACDTLEIAKLPRPNEYPVIPMDDSSVETWVSAVGTWGWLGGVIGDCFLAYWSELPESQLPSMATEWRSDEFWKWYRDEIGNDAYLMSDGERLKEYAEYVQDYRNRDFWRYWSSQPREWHLANPLPASQPDLERHIVAWRSGRRNQEKQRRRRRQHEKRKPVARAGRLSLRFRVLKRDQYRCQICGRTAQDGVKLEVDHRVPRAKGGQDTIGNLWVLCFECNRGKGTRDL